MQTTASRLFPWWWAAAGDAARAAAGAAPPRCCAPTAAALSRLRAAAVVALTQLAEMAGRPGGQASLLRIRGSTAAAAAAARRRRVRWGRLVRANRARAPTHSRERRSPVAPCTLAAMVARGARARARRPTWRGAAGMGGAAARGTTWAARGTAAAAGAVFLAAAEAPVGARISPRAVGAARRT